MDDLPARTTTLVTVPWHQDGSAVQGCPEHKHAWYRGLPGAGLAATVFLVASTGLRLYLCYVYSHGLTYGALATPITFLLFYYFISMATIIGAQFNNAPAGVLPAGGEKSGSPLLGSCHG